jgi:hypothetical protein
MANEKKRPKKKDNNNQAGSFLQRNLFAVLIFGFGFLLYANTLVNNYNLDDELVTKNHKLTSQGIKAIPEILTSPYYNDEMGYAYDYRPVVLISFAIEHQLFGDNPAVSHFINAALYAVLCLLVFLLLRSLFQNLYGPLIAFIISALFAAFPVHTEVVASIKNRDEILAFIFALSSWLLILKSSNRVFSLKLVAGVVIFCLGLLSKGTVLSLAILIPLSLIFFRMGSRVKALFLSAAFALCLVAFTKTNSIQHQLFLLVLPPALIALFLFVMYFKEYKNGLITFGKNMAAWYLAVIVKAEAKAARLGDVLDNRFFPQSKGRRNLTGLFLFAIGLASGLCACLLGYFNHINLQALALFITVLASARLTGIYRAIVLSFFIISESFIEYHFPSQAHPFLGWVLMNVIAALAMADKANRKYYAGLIVVLIFSSLAVFGLPGLRDSGMMAVLMLISIAVYGYIKKKPSMYVFFFQTGVFIIAAVAAKLFMAKGSATFLGKEDAVFLESLLLLVFAVFQFAISRISASRQLVLFYVMILLTPAFFVNWETLKMPFYKQSLLAERQQPNTIDRPEEKKRQNANKQLITDSTAYLQVNTKSADTAPMMPTLIPVKMTNRPVTYIEDPIRVYDPIRVKIASAFDLLLRYIKLAVIPYPLRFYYGYKEVDKVDFNDWHVLLSILIILMILVIATILYIRKHYAAVFGIMIFLVGLAPFTNIIQPVPGMMAERYLLFPSLGFCILLGCICNWYFKLDSIKDLRSLPNAAKYLIAIIMVCYAGLTIARNTQWQDDLTLMRHDVKYTDESVEAHNLLAVHLVTQSFNENEAEKQKALREEAVQHFRRANEIYPYVFNIQYDLGRTYLLLNLPDSAILSFAAATRADTSFPDVYLSLGDLYFQKGQYNEAAVCYRHFINILPIEFAGYGKLSYSYFKMNNIEQSLQVSFEAMQKIPGSPDPYFNVIQTFIATEQLDSAKYYLGKVQQLAPGDARVQQLQQQLNK